MQLISVSMIMSESGDVNVSRKMLFRETVLELGRIWFQRESFMIANLFI